MYIQYHIIWRAVLSAHSELNVYPDKNTLESRYKSVEEYFMPKCHDVIYLGSGDSL